MESTKSKELFFVSEILSSFMVHELRARVPERFKRTLEINFFQLQDYQPAVSFLFHGSSPSQSTCKLIFVCCSRMQRCDICPTLDLGMCVPCRRQPPPPTRPLLPTTVLPVQNVAISIRYLPGTPTPSEKNKCELRSPTRSVGDCESANDLACGANSRLSKFAIPVHSASLPPGSFLMMFLPSGCAHAHTCKDRGCVII